LANLPDSTCCPPEIAENLESSLASFEQFLVSNATPGIDVGTRRADFRVEGKIMSKDHLEHRTNRGLVPHAFEKGSEQSY
jgi:hypothetical protein